MRKSVGVILRAVYFDRCDNSAYKQFVVVGLYGVYCKSRCNGAPTRLSLGYIRGGLYNQSLQKYKGRTLSCCSVAYLQYGGVL